LLGAPLQPVAMKLRTDDREAGREQEGRRLRHPNHPPTH
jgi:hypothetical protein